MIDKEFRPNPTGNTAQDELNHRAFSYLYELRSMLNKQAAAPPQPPNPVVVNRMVSAGGAGQISLQGLSGRASSTSPQPSVLAGTHAARLAAQPQLYTNGLWVETDRQNALYYSTGGGWNLIEVAGFGTYEARWADLGPNDSGALYLETSRNNVSSVVPYPLFRWSGTAWTATRGIFARNQNAVAALGGTLTANDTGFQVDVLDFGRILQWSGAAFNYADPNDAPGRISFFLVDPPANGWVFCNGTNSTYLQGNGTTANITLPNASGANQFFLLGSNNANANLVTGAVVVAAPTNALGLRPFLRR